MPLQIRADQKVRLTVSSAGFDAETKAVFKIFRWGREEDGDEIETLEGATDDSGTATAEWSYEPEDGDRGELRFIYRCEVDGQWIKSDALTVVLPYLRDAKWDREVACVGDTVKLEVTCAGIKPDAEITLEIRKADDDSVLETLKTPPENGTAKAEWKITDPDPKAATADVYFAAKVDALETSSWPLAVNDVVELVLKDDKGGVLPKIEVALTFKDGHVEHHRADGQGRLRLEGVEPGEFELSVPGVDDDKLTLKDKPIR